MYEKFSRAFEISFPDNIRSIYNEAKTFHEFFHELARILGKEQACTFLQPWISKFIRDIILERRLLIEQQWIIIHPASSINLHQINENGYRSFSVGGQFISPPTKLVRVL